MDKIKIAAAIRSLRNKRHRYLPSGSQESPGASESQRRATINSHLRNAASSRDRRSSLPHRCGLSRSDSVVSSMARSFGIRCSARCLTLIVSHRCRIPRRLQQAGQTMSSRCSRSVRAHLPHVGHPNHDHEPPLGNLRRWTLTFFSTWPSWTRNSVVSGVMISSARSRAIETAGDHRGI